MNAWIQPLWCGSPAGVDVSVIGIGSRCGIPLELAVSVLSEAEKERAERFYFEADRSRWVRCRAALKWMLSDRHGLNAAEIAFDMSPYGKPGLVVDGERIHFNVSHSRDFAAVAFAGRPVGVDVEEARELPACELAAFAFRAEELDLIRGHADPARCFLELWTAKEAVMKCDGRGLALPPDQIILSGEGGHAEIEGTGECFQVLRGPTARDWSLAVAVAVA